MKKRDSSSADSGSNRKLTLKMAATTCLAALLGAAIGQSTVVGVLQAQGVEDEGTLVLPVGTVLAGMSNQEAFDRALVGTWVIADGRQKAAINDHWNYWEDCCPATDFDDKLPDLRGQFLRGIDGGRRPGHQQDDALKSHRHALEADIITPTPGNFHGVHHEEGPQYEAGRPALSLTGANETRPKNVAVYFYIRVH